MQKNNKSTTETKSNRRKYERPDFITSLAFERQALSCAGCLNLTPAFPFPNCSFQS